MVGRTGGGLNAVQVMKEKFSDNTNQQFPLASMYGIFTYIYHKNQANVGKYTIHGWQWMVWVKLVIGRRFFPFGARPIFGCICC